METRSRKRARLIITSSNNKPGEDTAGPKNGGAQEDSSATLEVFKVETGPMKGASLNKKKSRNNRRAEEYDAGIEEEAPNPSACVFGELLEQVFSYLSPRELKVSRQVSKNWNIEACRALRRRSFLLFDGERVKSLPNIVEVMEMGRALELPTPFEDIRGQLISSKSYTILRELTTKDLLPLLRITSLEPRVVLRRRLPVVHRALIKLAPHLKNLDFFYDFYAVRFPNIPLMEHLRFPQLKSLGFMIDESTNQESVDFIVGVINGSPQLVELNFKYFPFHVESATALSEIYTRANLRNIEKLTVINYDPVSFLLVLDDLLLIQNHNSLKTLWIATSSDFRHGYSLRLMRLITKFGDTLQNLSFNFNVERAAVSSLFPFLGKLTSLELRDFNFENQFWSRVPALKRFKCRRVSFTENELNAGQRVKHLSLEEFTYQRYVNVDAEYGAQYLHDTFPGLTSLIRLGPQNPR